MLQARFATRAAQAVRENRATGQIVPENRFHRRSIEMTENRDPCDEPINIARFDAGRDLAIRMLREGTSPMLFQRAALEARERNVPEQPQHRWVLRYLLELQLDPRLLDGFSAVLSDYLASGSGGTPDHYERVQRAELTRP
jgi:hypothetical protein